MIKPTNDEITPDYLNKKLESMMLAIFDSIGEMEERMKNMEKQLFEAKNAENKKAS
jgi:nucleoside-triphosphatase THEP1|tara:strand:+ start:137 stop:304 length:168 start_codon:yes stop_codon:yes gene_type:complete